MTDTPLTPAQALAAGKRRQRPKRNPPAKSERVRWVCELRRIREDHELSMRDVAKAIGISVSAYFRIENGYADVSLSNACKLADFFGTDIRSIWVKECE